MASHTISRHSTNRILRYRLIFKSSAILNNVYSCVNISLHVDIQLLFYVPREFLFPFIVKNLSSL